jgi:hypothetical protein
MGEKKKRNLLLSLLVGILVIIALGVSYSYFLASLSGKESASTVSADSGSMSIKYIPTNSSGTEITTTDNYIYAAKISPSPSPFAIKYFKVKGDNTTSKTMAYQLTLVLDTNTFSDGSIKYVLESTNTSSNGAVVPSVSTKTPISGTTTITVGNGSFTTGSNLYHSYTIKFYFPDTDTDQSTDMSKEFKAHIIVNSIQAS